jgi:EmrB/QacA subfamily drug resistance transporter
MALSKRNRTTLLIAMIFAVSMTTIDQTIVALSADTIQKNLAISHAAVAWSINAYILATAAFFILGGKLADVFGHKRMAIIGILTFATFSLLSGLTPTGGAAGAWLITARTLQGIGTAMMFPAALGIVLSIFPSNSRGKAVATFFGVTGGMTALGPILGGYLTEWTWRSIFWINIPIAIAALLLVSRQAVPAQGTRQKIDWPGAALVAASMALAIVGLQQAGSWGWDSALTWLFVAAGVILLAAFIGFERNRPAPLVRLESFKERGFSISVLATLFSSMAFVPIFFFLSVYAQISLGLDVYQSALLLLEFFIGFVLASNYGGRLFDKRGARRPIIIGGAASAIGFAWWASRLNDLSNGAAFLNSPQFWPTVLAGAGIGFMFSAAATDVANRAKGQSYGQATGISQTAKNFGGAFGLAVLTAIVSTQLTSNLNNSFAALGAPAGAGKSIAMDINSGDQSAGHGHGSKVAAYPPAIQRKIEKTIETGYADATKPAFYGMSVAMAIVFLLGLAYPRGAKTPEKIST